MIQSFNNGRFCLWFTQWTLQPPAFLSSYFLTATIPVKLPHLLKALRPLSYEDGWSEPSWSVIKWLFCEGWGQISWAEQAGQQFFFFLFLRIQSSVSGNSWVLSTVGITQLYFDMKAFVTVILAHWDLIKKWNAPVLPPLGSLSLPFIQ